jgi:hypothetical protein
VILWLFHRKIIYSTHFYHDWNYCRYSIDDLLTPNSSLTNITGLQNGDTARSLLGSLDGMATNVNNTTNRISPSSTGNHTIPIMDPLHGLLLGNTTAFDAVITQQEQERCTHASPSQQQVAATTTASPNNRFKPTGTTDIDPSSLIINGKNSFTNRTILFCCNQ